MAKHDEELATIGKIVRILEAMDDAARARAVEYLVARYQRQSEPVQFPIVGI